MSATTYCKACNKQLNVIYYQRRAADEPPDKVVYCSNCPLDTSRLKFTDNTLENNNIVTVVSDPKISVKKNRTKLSQSLTFHETIVSIRVTNAAALKCLRSIKTSNLESTPILGIPTYINTRTKPVASYYYKNSVSADEAHTIIKSQRIAPYIYYDSIDVYSIPNGKSKDLTEYNTHVLGYEYILPSIPGSSYTVLRVLHNDQKPFILLKVLETDMSLSSTTLSILEHVLAEYGTEISIKSIVNNTMLNSLYIQSGRAYDWPSAPNHGYTYTWKPDGERFWYIKYGSVWLFCRPRLSGKIAGWNISKDLQFVSTPGPILDVEVMIGFPPILIDVLVKNTGQTAVISRTLDSVLNDFNYMAENGIIDVPIYIRDYYRSEKELLSTKQSLAYPVDGVVGIQDGSMTIIKLKDEKSIELELRNNGDLVSSDGKVIVSSNLHNTYEPKDILEVRFVKQSGSDIPRITEVFPRTDKIKANDFEACQSILSTVSSTPDTLARHNAVEWCNLIRRKLHHIATNVAGRGRVILDIGAGDGQSVSDYSTDPEVTYLLLEPDMRKCKSMIRRLQDKSTKDQCKLFTDSRSSINILGLLTKKKLKYAVLCANLKDVLEEEYCIFTLKKCIRYCIASFSISYIVPELQSLAIEGINIIGSGYMYDSVDKHGVLIDEHGVTMKYNNYTSSNKSSTAIVSWGSDKTYAETAIVLNDFKELFYPKLARNIVPVISDSKTSLVSTIASKVYIISSNKYTV